MYIVLPDGIGNQGSGPQADARGVRIDEKGVTTRLESRWWYTCKALKIREKGVEVIRSAEFVLLFTNTRYRNLLVHIVNPHSSSRFRRELAKLALTVLLLFVELIQPGMNR